MSIAARQKLCDRLVFQKDSQRADLLDPARTDSGLIALMLDVDTFHFEVTAVRSDHHDDGANGHAGGRALDGWPLNGPTPGDYMDETSPHFADFLETLADSPWVYQIGLGGAARTEANFRAAGPKGFDDNDQDHIHAGSVKA